MQRIVGIFCMYQISSLRALHRVSQILYAPHADSVKFLYHEKSRDMHWQHVQGILFQDGGYIFEAENSVAEQHAGRKAKREWKVTI